VPRLLTRKGEFSFGSLFDCFVLNIPYSFIDAVRPIVNVQECFAKVAQLRMS
jgi:hypothetical protein